MIKQLLIASGALIVLATSSFAIDPDESKLPEVQKSKLDYKTREPKKEELIKKSLILIKKRIQELEERFTDLSKIEPPSYGSYSRDYQVNPEESKRKNLPLKSIRTTKNKVTIINEDIPQDYEGRHVVSHLKFVEYELSGNKIKTIRLVYEKKNFFEDINNVTKTLTIDPSQIEENTVIEETQKDSILNKEFTDRIYFKEFSSDTKYQTLKSLEKQLLTAIFKVEMLMRHRTLKKENDAIQIMTDI